MKKTPKVQPNSTPIVEKMPNNSLITFDKRVKIFLLANLIVFALLVLFKIQGSSTPIWNSFFGIDQKKAKNILYGEPRGIRQDEWSTWVPNTINQCRTGFKHTNYNLGGGESAYLHSYVPIDDIRDFFRPKVWGYHLFDIETGYSFEWNLRIFGLIVSAFLLFLIFTRNNFWLSVFGALWLFLSSGQQWWSNNQGELMSFVFFIVVSLMSIIYSKSKKNIVMWAVLLLIFSHSFVVVMYPPWQIPLAYLMICLIVGYLITNWSKILIYSELALKISVAAGILVVLGGLTFKLLYDASDAIEMTMNTAYPGKRLITGGDLHFTRIFSQYFGYFITDVKTPAVWLNICEASGYLVFFPIVFYYLIRSFINKVKVDYTLVILAGFLCVSLVWMLLGLPSLIAKMLFFHVIPGYRLLPIFQIASVVMTVIYLSKKSDKKINIIEIASVGVVALVSIYLIGINTNKTVDGFFKPSQITIVTIIFAACYVLLIIPQYKWRNLIFGAVILLFLLPNIRINPVTKGLKALLENPLVRQVRPIHDADPNPKWAVFGNVLLANLLKVEGINVFNGMKSPPIIAEMKIFDPTGKDNFVYNRGGYNNLFSFVDGKDSTVFKLNENNTVNDTYSMYADPCGDKMKSIGVKYILFTYQPQAAEIRCMTLISSDILPIYKIND